MSDFPSHASPYFSPQPLHPKGPITLTNSNTAPTSSPFSNIRNQSSVSDTDTESESRGSNHTDTEEDVHTPSLPDSILSPAITPPLTPGNLQIQQHFSAESPKTTVNQKHRSIDSKERISHHSKPPKLLPRLPHVECIVRARIPTTIAGSDMFLHLYQNDADNKEHLAIVFGNNIRSRSLDRVREGETEMDRMIRGAYVGRLRPGRISSRYDETDDVNMNTATDRVGVSAVNDTGDQMVEGVTGANGPQEGTAPSPDTKAPLVRIHSECYTGETAWSARCDCGEQLDEAARLMSESSASQSSSGGVIIYLRQEGRGIGLGEKLKAYNLQDLGSDTVEANILLRHPADARSYGLATAMLVDLGLGNDSATGGIRLLTNNPDKVSAVEGPNKEIAVKERVPMIPIAWRTGGTKGIRSTEIEGYLNTKVYYP